VSTNTLTILGFLAMLAITLIGGARIAIWLYSESDRRVQQMVNDALERREDDAHNSWSREEWWR